MLNVSFMKNEVILKETIPFPEQILVDGINKTD